MIERDWHVVAPDGCIWIVSWFTDAAGFFADVWDPDEILAESVESSDDAPTCLCPFAAPGIYDTLDTLEVAVGGPIPDHVREELLNHARLNPIFEDEKAAWGRIFALEVHRTGPDGTITSSFAPTWANEPTSPRWDDDNFPLVE